MNSASCRDEIRTNHNDSDKVIFDSAVNLGLSLPTGGFALIARGALKGSGYLMKGIGSANRVVESAALVKLGQAGAKVSNFAPKITASYAPLYFGHNAANLYWGGVGMHEAWDMCHESYSSSVIEQANQARKTKQSVCDQNVKAAIPNQQLQSCLMAVGMGALNLIPFAPMAIRAIANKMKPKLVDDLIPNGNGAGVIKLSKGETPGNIKVDEPNAPKTAKADEPELKKSNKDEPNVNAKGPAINGSAESPGKSCARALAAGKTRVPSPIGFPGSIGKWVNGIGVVTQSLAGAIGMGAGAYGAYESLKGKSEEAAEPAITLTQADIPHLSALDADLAKWSDEKTGLKNAPQEFKDAVAVARKTIAQKIGEIRAAK
jgi:hypothetical protein